MTTLDRFSRALFMAIDIENWPMPESLLLGEEKRRIFENRVKAIKLYHAGCRHKDIEQRTAINRSEAARLVKRCLAVGNDGTVEGYRALLPYRHVHPSRQRAIGRVGVRTGYSGAFSALLRDHPHIRKNLDALIITGKLKRTAIAEPCKPLYVIHAEFLNWCKKAGLTANDYPFCVQEHGYKALSRYRQKLRALHYRQAAASDANDEAIQKLITGTGEVRTSTPVTHPFQRVELDGHKIDMHCTIAIPTLNGAGESLVSISRLWLLVLLDVFSKAVLGYALVPAVNYSARDLMRAIRSALIPWKPLTLTIPTIRYPTGGGLPSGIIPALAYSCWDELHVDNALANLSDFFLTQLQRSVRCVPVYGPTHQPDSRPFIEGFFNLFERMGFQRMPGAVKHGQRQNKNAIKEAIKYKVTMEELQHLADVIIAKYNTGKASDTHLTRLEILKNYVNSSRTLVRRIPEERREKVVIYDSHLHLKIHGSSHSGRRPHVIYEGSRYTNLVLSSAFGLVGKYITALGASSDLRRLEAYFPDGTPIGTLFAENRWRHVPHSLDTRKAVNRLRRENRLHLQIEEDYPTSYRRHLEESARSSKNAATELARVMLEQDLWLPTYAPLKQTPDEKYDEEIEETYPSEGSENEAIDLFEGFGTTYGPQR
jgi:putative transposase